MRIELPTPATSAPARETFTPAADPVQFEGLGLCFYEKGPHRIPEAGEFYLSGAIVHAYRAHTRLGAAFRIVRPVALAVPRVVTLYDRRALPVEFRPAPPQGRRESVHEVRGLDRATVDVLRASVPDDVRAAVLAHLNPNREG